MPNWKKKNVSWKFCGETYREDRVYSPDMGRIDRFEISREYDYLEVTCGKLICRIGQKSTFTRGSSRVVTYLKGDKEAVERERKEITALADARLVRMFGYSDELACVTDPRFVRAYILVWYGNFNESERERVKSLLETSVDLNIPAAAEWMKRNKFRYTGTPEEFPIDGIEQAYSDYLLCPNKLIDPYWLPIK